MTDEDFLRQAVRLSQEGSDAGAGGPFGAVIVQAGAVVAAAHNRVLLDGDPTAHAEIVAIRTAARALGTHHLTGCTLYASCEPCPMCLGALLWARVERLVYANSRAQAAAIGFADQQFYDEFARPPEERALPTHHLALPEAAAVFDRWAAREGRRLY